MPTPDYASLLLIEDNPGDARLILEMFRETSLVRWDITTADRLDSALEKINGHPYDAILLDLNLPDSTGVDTFRRVQAAASASVIVVLTGLDDASVGATAVGLGAQDYLNKNQITSTVIERALIYGVERKTAQAAVLQAQQFAQSAVDALSAQIAILDETGRIVAVNRAWSVFALENGGDDFQFVGSNYLNICESALPPDAAGSIEFAAGIRAVMRGETEEYLQEYPCHFPTEERWFLGRVTRFYGQGRVFAVVAHEDVTGRKQAEVALRRSEEKFSKLFSTSPDIIALTTLEDGRYIDVNEGFVQAYGFSREEVISHTATELQLWLRPELRQQMVGQLLQEGHVHNFEAQVRCKSGEIRIILISAERIDLNGERCFLSVAKDITDRKAMEETVRENEARFRGLFETMIEGVAIHQLVVDDHGEPVNYRLVAVNPAFTTQTGIARERALGQLASEVYRSNPAPYLALYARVAMTGQPIQFEQYFDPLQRHFAISAFASGPGAFTTVFEDISERKRAEAELARYQENLEELVEQRTAELNRARRRVEAILNNTTDGIALTGADLRVEAANRTFDRLFRSEPDAYFGQPLAALAHPDDRERLAALLAAVIADGVGRSAEFRGLRADGTWFEARVGLGYVRADEGVVSGLVCSLSDITEDKAQERLLRFNAVIQENVLDAVITTDLDFQIQTWNPGAERAYGWKASDVIGRNSEQVLRSEFEGEDRASVVQKLFADGHWQGQATQRCQDESKIAVLASVSLLNDESGRPIGVVSVNRDITPRIRAERALKQKTEQDQQFQTALSALHEITLELTPIDDLDLFCRQVVALGRGRLGLDRVALFLYDDEQDKAKGTYGTDQQGRLKDEHHLRFSPPPESVMARALATDERYIVEENVLLYEELQPVATGWNAASLLHNGAQRIGWLVTDNAVEHGPLSEPLLAIFALYALTISTLLVRKETNLSLRISEASLATAQQIAHMGNWELELRDLQDMNNNSLRWSDELYRIFGFQPGEIEVSDAAFLRAVHPDDRERITKALAQTLETGEAYNVEHRILRPDGSERFVHELSTVLYDTVSGRPIHLLGTTQDITERKMAEIAVEQALESEKELNRLKSRFVSMASHEFRTPMATVLAATDLLRRYRSKMDDERIDQKLATIVQQVQYLTAIIDDVLDLSRLQSGRADFNPIALDLDSLCAEVLAEFRGRADVGQALHYRVSQSPLMVTADKRLIREVINNLVSNAVKYSPADGPVGVELKSFEDAVILRVSDHGIGIPAEDQKHLFEPFHRAGNVGTIAGTGLGLSITKQAIELHGGTIVCESEEGRGTTFIVTLPQPPTASKRELEPSGPR